MPLKPEDLAIESQPVNNPEKTVKVSNEVDEPSQITEIVAPAAPRRRWKRDDDKKMFAFLREY